MKRPRGRPKKSDTLGYVRDVLARHGPVWARFCSLRDADPIKRGRVDRAEVACAIEFGIDKKTVQTKVRLMRPFAEAAKHDYKAARLQITSEAEYRNKTFEDAGPQLDQLVRSTAMLIERLIDGAIRDGLISRSTGAEMALGLSPHAIREIIALARRAKPRK